MEKWTTRGKSIVRSETDYANRSSVEKKRGRKWSFGGLLKRISKNEAIADDDSQYRHNSNPQIYPTSSNNCLIRSGMSYQPAMRTKCHQSAIKHPPGISHNESKELTAVYNTSLYSPNNNVSLDALRNIRRNSRLKARLKSKRDRISLTRSSSDDEQHKSNSSSTQTEDNFIQNGHKNDVNRKSRGARTERYMKRLCREDTNGGNDGAITNGSVCLVYPPLIVARRKYSSDTLSPTLWKTNDDLQSQSSRSSRPTCHQTYASEQNITNVLPRKTVMSRADLHSKDKHTWPQSHERRVMPINESDKFSKLHMYTRVVKSPPEPPPRSSKPRSLSTSQRLSLHNSDMESNNSETQISRYERLLWGGKAQCNSLDRIHTSPKKKKVPHEYMGASTNSLDHYRPQLRKNQSLDNDRIDLEQPIVPIYRTILPQSVAEDNEQERKRQSKNLEEALQELETIYNSLRLSDEDMLDRAEQRSMEEYRDKVATTAVEGSIKSSSDTSSSYEMAGELGWRHASFDPCHDTRMKDDMAYRRMHQNERSSSVDPNQTSLSQISYLAVSPNNISHREMDYLPDRPKSRRATPDLTRDDVVFRSINHANNTLKIVEPQPPFGIPLGPVTTATESDYLHVEPPKMVTRSLYIPQSEPDIISDDLAFRNLRKDATKSSNPSLNTSFLPKSGFTPEIKKRRAVRSLSADLYGIINKNDSQHSWYKEYVKLNRPLRISENEKSSVWLSNREYCDLDINGNRPNSTYKGRVQVCVPQEEEEERIVEKKMIDLKSFAATTYDRAFSSSSSSPEISCEKKNITPFTEDELSEYQQLCRDLESLIRKTSEKVKSVDVKSDIESRKSSLTEFVEWEELVDKNESPSLSNPEKKTQYFEETVDCINRHSNSSTKVPYESSTISDAINREQEDREEVEDSIKTTTNLEHSNSTLASEQSSDDDSAALKSCSPLLTLDDKNNGETTPLCEDLEKKNSRETLDIDDTRQE